MINNNYNKISVMCKIRRTLSVEIYMGTISLYKSL